MITMNSLRFIQVSLLLIIFGTRTEGNLQSWSIKQKSGISSESGFSSVPISGSVPFSSQPGDIIPKQTNPNLDDPTCSEILYGSKEENKEQVKETQRGQLTIDILKCILKELRNPGGGGISSRVSGMDGPSFLPKRDESDGESLLERKWLPRNYDKLEVPLDLRSRVDIDGVNSSSVVKPVQVDFFLNIGEVLDFSEVDHYLGFDVEIIAGWTDWKIQQNSAWSSEGDVYLSGDFLDKIWTPDFFFEQIASVSNPNVGVEPKTIVLNPVTGYIKFKSRMLLNLYCDFDFFYYPADSQECHFTLTSYSYTSKLVNISWFNFGIYLHRTYDYNFEYQVVSATRKEVPEHIGRWTNFDEKHATLEFVVKSRRKLSYHLVQTYVPSVILVVVTWLCFLIPREQSEVRVGVAMTTLLTITAMFSSVRATAPAVSYVKAIDYWMCGSIFVIFATLAGFLAIAWIQKKDKLRQIQRITVPTYHPGGYESKDIMDIPHPPHLHLPPSEFCPIHSQFNKTQLINSMTPPNHPDSSELGSLTNGDSATGESCCAQRNLAKKLDDVLVSLVPTSFIIFVISYWMWLLLASGYHNWTLNEDYNRVHV